MATIGATTDLHFNFYNRVMIFSQDPGLGEKAESLFTFPAPHSN